MGAEDVVVELIAVDIGDIRPQHECRLISQLYPLQYRRLTRRQLNRVWFRSNQHTNRLFDIFERGFHLSAVDQGVPTTAGGQRPPAPQRVGQWHRLRRLTASKWKPPIFDSLEERVFSKEPVIDGDVEHPSGYRVKEPVQPIVHHSVLLLPILYSAAESAIGP